MFRLMFLLLVLCATAHAADSTEQAAASYRARWRGQPLSEIYRVHGVARSIGYAWRTRTTMCELFFEIDEGLVTDLKVTESPDCLDVVTRDHGTAAPSAETVSSRYRERWLGYPAQKLIDSYGVPDIFGYAWRSTSVPCNLVFMIANGQVTDARITDSAECLSHGGP